MELKSILGIFLLVTFSSEQVWGISRSQVISNAETWLDPPVPYSQTQYKDNYRTDCSGYVSMAWATASNYNTNTLVGITTSITKDNLKKGDILLKSGSHVTIFKEWANAAKSEYWGFEQVGGRINKTKYWKIPYPYWGGAAGYVPRRFTGITD